MVVDSNVSNGLSELIKRSRRELIKFQDDGNLNYQKVKL